MRHFLTSPEVLSADNLTIVRGDTVLVENLSLQVSPGDLLWVTGTNGIGKTSLLKCLCGLLRPAQGSILWGENNTQSTDLSFAGYQGHLDAHKGDLTVLENLQFWANCYGGDPELMPALETVGLAEKAGIRAKGLSAGQSRRLSLARLMLKRAPLWVMDEPGAAMDKDGKALIHLMITKQIQRGGAVILASHATPEKIDTHTRVLRFSDGMN